MSQQRSGLVVQQPYEWILDQVRFTGKTLSQAPATSRDTMSWVPLGQPRGFDDNRYSTRVLPLQDSLWLADIGLSSQSGEGRDDDN